MSWLMPHHWSRDDAALAMPAAILLFCRAYFLMASAQGSENFEMEAT